MRCQCCQRWIPRGPRNAGQPWTYGLDNTLRRYVRVYREMAMPVEEAIPLLMERFGRSHASIYARLLKLDLITP